MKEFTREQIINVIGEAFPEVAHIYYKNPKLRKENEHQVFYTFDVSQPVYNSKKIFETCYKKITQKFKVENKKVHHFEYWDEMEGSPGGYGTDCETWP